MPDQRISPDHIAALKAWLTTNKEALLTKGIDRIDAHYTDDDLAAGAITEIQAFSISDSGRTFTGVPFPITTELGALLEGLTDSDNFFPGQQGGGGSFRLWVESGRVEHASFEYVTGRRDHALEVY